MALTNQPKARLSQSRVTLLKVTYDALGAAAAITLAFLTRFALLYLQHDPTELRPDLRDVYLGLYFKHLGVFVAITLGTLWAIGFYRPVKNARSLWKPLQVIGGVSIAPVLWSLFIYYSLELKGDFLFPRGVTVLTWVYLLVAIGIPRITKYILLNRMVIEVHHHRRDQIRRVLVIGGAGYIGSQLCRDLLNRGYQVRILDSLLFGKDSINEIEQRPGFDVVAGDFRNIETVIKSMDGVDAVVHLGGIVGDPACSLDDDFTIDVNLTATKMLAEVCKAFKVQRFIFASSCSVYGAAENELLTEDSALNPVSLYARTKIASEQVLLDAAGPDFSPSILRFATLFGLSPRPRFDLFVNLVTAKAIKDHKFTVFGGKQWRPFVHVKDVSKAVTAVLEAPVKIVHGEIFNIGSEENTCTIEDAAQIVAQVIPGTQIDHVAQVDDPRDYRVSFEKMRMMLGFTLDTTIAEGVREMQQAFLDGRLTEYSETTFSNLRQTEKLLSDGDQKVHGSTSMRLVPSPRGLLSKIANK